MGVGNSRNRTTMDESTRMADSDSADDDSSVFRILHQLIRTGQVRLISEDSVFQQDRQSSSEDEEDSVMMTMKEALSSADDLMMGHRKSQPTTPDLSIIKDNDICTDINLSGGQCTNLGSKGLCRRVALRQMGLGSSRWAAYASSFTPGDRCYLTSMFLPNKKRVVATFRTKTFCSQFTKTGESLVTASQDQVIRFYQKQRDQYRLQRAIHARDVGWSILDVAISPDARHLIYGTWSDFIHEFATTGDTDSFEAYNLESTDYRFCVFSVRYSADGEEILAGCSDRKLYVYGRDEKKVLLKIDAHEDDINAVCFGDSSSNIIFSGGDDGLCKVWDRRELNEKDPNPVGVLAGHLDGITYIDSKGDGRYLLTNSKDQTIKLWDLRKFSSSHATEATRQAVSKQRWDYRWQSVPRRARKTRKLEGDSSVMTYRGHTVLHTLIRCYFSPQATTGCRYIYTGSARGSCIIYDLLTGEVVAKLDGHRSCVRDVSWHPFENEICTSSWDGTTAVWRFDERCRRNVNPDAGPEAPPGDEDSTDEDGLRRKNKSSRRKRLAAEREVMGDDWAGRLRRRPLFTRSPDGSSPPTSSDEAS